MSESENEEKTNVEENEEEGTEDLEESKHSTHNEEGEAETVEESGPPPESEGEALGEQVGGLWSCIIKRIFFNVFNFQGRKVLV
jgi:hypothetical protein